jgi:hypothetical protein
MTDDPRDLLIEKASSAFRERNASGRILPSPSWFDLAPADREALFDLQLESRLIERALHCNGLSTTVQAVLSRLHDRDE